MQFSKSENKKGNYESIKKVVIEVCLPACSAEMTMRCGLEKSYSQDDNDMVAIAYAREVKNSPPPHYSPASRWWHW